LLIRTVCIMWNSHRFLLRYTAMESI